MPTKEDGTTIDSEDRKEFSESKNAKIYSRKNQHFKN